MAFMNWQISPFGTYIIDITLAGGTAQAYFLIGFPGDQSSLSAPSTVLTASLAVETATALLTALEGLSGVTSASMTEISAPQLSPGQLYFPAAQWAYYFSQVDQEEVIDGWYAGSQMSLLLSSPADGLLSQGQVDSLAAGLSSTLNAVSGVSGVDLTQATYTPTTA